MNYEVNGNKLYFLIAPARAGKSTYCRKWESEKAYRTEMIPDKPGGYDIHFKPRVVVNADSLRLAAHGNRWNGYMEGMIHAMNEIIIKKYLLMGYDVLVDETNCSLKAIKRILSIRNDAIPIILNISVQTCFDRAEATNQGDLIPVIQRMFKNLYEIWDKYRHARCSHGLGPHCDLCRGLGEFCLSQEKWNIIIDRIREEVESPNLRIV